MGSLNKTRGESVGKLSDAAAEVWHYTYIQGIGAEAVFEFADVCNCGDFHITKGDADSMKQDACRDSLCLDRKEPKHEKPPSDRKPIDQLVMPPRVRFKDLEEVVTTRVRYNLLPFNVQAGTVRATEFTDWVSLTLQFQKRDLLIRQDEGRYSVNLHVYARFTTLAGRIAATIEDEIKNADDASDAATGVLRFSRSLALQPGRYRLDVAVRDVNADKMGTWSRGVILLAFYADDLATSPLILAEQLDTHARPDAKPPGGFDIGDVRIQPTIPASSDVPAIFHSGEQIRLFLQAYNLSVNQKSGKSDALVTYKIINANTGRIAIDLQETSAGLRQFGEQITLQQSLPTTDVAKGEYRVCVIVTDQIAHRSSTSTVLFSIQ